MDITQKAHNCLWNMERGRIRAAPIQTRTLQRERSHHRYMNTKLPYKRVYRGPTFTEAGVNIDSTKHLLKMIVTDLQTPRLVEEYGFRHFMKALNPIIDV
ncbi:hypothetical protein QTP70_031721 [Hemibagrus guttatus]|uniref:Uncharacterized protein n=1 Tax=Hemibagrus guttatus TaxID=175788 RepID=A0AAE0QRA8_9TELE|nr:hypothetical protein QTP70_031721 [Hemibagrus guttatus]